jgi:hypothetical protein
MMPVWSDVGVSREELIWNVETTFAEGARRYAIVAGTIRGA